jgi:hypothetical protein
MRQQLGISAVTVLLLVCGPMQADAKNGQRVKAAFKRAGTAIGKALSRPIPLYKGCKVRFNVAPKTNADGQVVVGLFPRADNANCRSFGIVSFARGENASAYGLLEAYAERGHAGAGLLAFTDDYRGKNAVAGLGACGGGNAVAGLMAWGHRGHGLGLGFIGFSDSKNGVGLLGGSGGRHGAGLFVGWGNRGNGAGLLMGLSDQKDGYALLAAAGGRHGVGGLLGMGVHGNGISALWGHTAAAKGHKVGLLSAIAAGAKKATTSVVKRLP